MLVIDLGDVPANMSRRLLSLPSICRLGGQAYSNAHPPHRDARLSRRAIALPILSLMKSRGMRTRWVGPFGLEADANNTVFDVDARRSLQRFGIDEFEPTDRNNWDELGVVADARTLAAVEEVVGTGGGVYVRLCGCKDVLRHTLSSLATDHFTWMADDAPLPDTLGRAAGCVRRITDARLVPATLLHSRRTTDKQNDPLRAWRECAGRDDDEQCELVARANGARQVAEACLEALDVHLGRVLESRVAMDARWIIVFSSGVVNMGAHNGTPHGPWGTRGICVIGCCNTLNTPTTPNTRNTLPPVHGVVSMTIVVDAVRKALGLDEDSAPRTTNTLAATLGDTLVRGTGYDKAFIECNLRTYSVVAVHQHIVCACDTLVDSNEVCNLVTQPQWQHSQVHGVLQAAYIQLMNDATTVPDAPCTVLAQPCHNFHTGATIAPQASELRPLLEHVGERVWQWLGLEEALPTKEPLTLFVPIGNPAAWGQWAPLPIAFIAQHNTLTTLANQRIRVPCWRQSSAHVVLSMTDEKVVLNKTATIVGLPDLVDNVMVYRVVRFFPG